jgi:hypothetical protein
MGPETEPFTHQRKVQNIGNTISETDKQLAGPHKNSKKHIYEQHGLHENLNPVVMNLLNMTEILLKVALNSMTLNPGVTLIGYAYTSNLTTVVNSVLKFMINGTTSILKSSWYRNINFLRDRIRRIFS